ncbi:macrophage migration inhibitory factor-like [Coregonus clupeaformis]|uniref:macrophage migration inhibitory factor-like n=1 Tax=Coregonus clupeaformis TaxID=59861 RepID=UPI001BE0C1EE|nr:macrophage migration inhibitory factor-like [Coregonus clupeaformis]
MPIFVVHTNVCRDNVPVELLSEATAKLAEAMELPVKYFAINIVADQLMTFGGTTAPCAHCSLNSIGSFSEEKNLQYSKLLCGLLKKHLGISPDRMYVDFFDMEPQNVAWDNKTFKVLIDAKNAKTLNEK